MTELEPIFSRNTRVEQIKIIFGFLPARRYDSAGNSDRNVPVCPSVCPSHAGIVSKRRKLASWFLHYLVAPRFWFSDAKFHHQILRGFPRSRASNKGGVGKFRFTESLLCNVRYYEWFSNVWFSFAMICVTRIRKSRTYRSARSEWWIRQ